MCMKRKELKNLAKKIANAEYIVQHTDDMKDKGELCQVLLQFQYNNTSLLKSIRNSISFRIFDTIQFFAQMLPWSFKMKVKHLLKQA